MLAIFLLFLVLLPTAWADCKTGLAAYAKEDYSAALAEFKGATDGCSEYALGVLYERGRGVTQDRAEALKWYRLAADQKYALAQYNLGVMYTRGNGTPQDYKEAVKLYSAAAEQGLAVAQYNLGMMYAQGRGVEVDVQQAAKWYVKGAAQGDVDSQFALAYLYEYGEGVPQDYVQAYTWYGLVLTKFDKAAVAIKGRDNVAKNLTPAQIAQADAAIQAWKPVVTPAP